MNTKWEIMDYVKSMDIVILAETFIEEKNVDYAIEKLPHSHNWSWAPATRDKEKGRASGGMIMGVSKIIHVVN